MTKAYVAVLAAIVVIALGGIALGKQDPQTATCPDGQTLAVAKVNGDTFAQKAPPPGGYYTDSVSGQGLDYTVRSTKDSATLKVHGRGAATFEVACR